MTEENVPENTNEEIPFQQPLPLPKAKKARKKVNAGSINDQIAFTSSLPVANPPKSWFKRAVLVTIVMIILLYVGVHKLPELKSYVHDHVSFVSQIPASTESVQEKAEEAPAPKTELVRADETIAIFKIGDKEEIRTEGTMSWRFNNPGMIYYGEYAKSLGAIGSDGRYAVFPSYDIGKIALKRLLFESDRGYKNKTLADAMKRYAPKTEGFNTDFYLKTIGNDTKIPMSKVLTDFSEDEKDLLLKTLEKIERFTIGKVEVK